MPGTSTHVSQCHLFVTVFKKVSVADSCASIPPPPLLTMADPVFNFMGGRGGVCENQLAKLALCCIDLRMDFAV